MAPEKTTREKTPSTLGKRASAGAPGAPRPVFWKELYWFVLICLGGWILGMSLLAPRLERDRQAHELEARLNTVIQRLARKERQYEEAISAMETDPYYREAVYRTVLGVRKEDEILLKNPERLSDN